MRNALAQAAEVKIFGRPWLEALPVAILLGAAVRMAWTPGRAWTPGIAFCAKILLEVAVVRDRAALLAERAEKRLHAVAQGQREPGEARQARLARGADPEVAPDLAP